MIPFSVRQVLLLGLLTLSSRVLLGLLLGVLGRPEWWEYDVIADSIVGGHGHAYERLGFVYMAYAPPVWSYVLALLLEIPGGSRVSLQALQALLCFGSAIIYGVLARRVSDDDRVGVLTGFLVALQPSLLYYSVVKSDPLPLNVFLLGLITLVGVELLRSPTSRRSFAMGLLLAVAVLARGTPIIILPIVGAGLLARWGRVAVTPILIMIAALALGLAPWLIRNERLLGRALITTTTGENLWRGNHEGATGGVLGEGGGDITSLIASNDALPATIRRVLENGTEIDRQDVFLAEALRFVVQQPEAAGHLFAKKMRTFWWRIDSDPSDYPQVATIAYEFIYRTELMLAIIGAVLLFIARRPKGPASDGLAAALTISVMVGVSVLQSVFYVQGRHRFMIEPLLLIFTANGLNEARRRFSKAV